MVGPDYRALTQVFQRHVVKHPAPVVLKRRIGYDPSEEDDRNADKDKSMDVA